MLSVNILFVFLASLVFLGFILNSLFSKIKIASIVPLMLIGLLIGPVFKFVQTTPNSIIIQLSPFITAVAVSFILFDVGLNINFFKLDLLSLMIPPILKVQFNAKICSLSIFPRRIQIKYPRIFKKIRFK